MKRRFMLHYNFPPFSVGEVGRMTGVGRREIGHGALASRAIEAVLPREDESPYTVRIVSDILESNGSSSMATVCGASLALMQAGIKIKGSVAGVAMGLVKEGDNYAVLSDIAGAEDHYGDMDFKVAGTRKGITALQMDIKIMGITAQIMREALAQAKQRPHPPAGHHGRDHRLRLARRSRSSRPASTPSRSPPTRSATSSDPAARSSAASSTPPASRSMSTTPAASTSPPADADGLARAIQMISDITAVPEPGKTYLGKVVRLAEFGAFVEIFPGTDGLLHVSEIAEHRVAKVSDELREGDQILVKVLAIEGNRIKLSRKAVLREQRAKLGLPEAGQPGAPQSVPSRTSAAIAAPGGFDDDEDETTARS